MTRGYIIVKKGRKIKAAYWLPSDAYPSGNADSYCGTVVAAFKSGNFADYIANGLEDEIERGTGATVEGSDFSREDYIKTAKNKDCLFVDYTYEYDEAKDTLAIYYYGRKILVFERDQIPYMEYLFGSDESGDFGGYYRVIRALSYDADKLCFYGTDGDAAFMDFMAKGATTDEIEAEVIESLRNAHVEIHSGRIMDVCRGGYKKRVSLLDGDGNSVYDFEFCVSFSDFMPKRSQYSLLIQTPVCRRQIGFDYGSAGAAEKQLVNFLKGAAFIARLKKTAEAYKAADAMQDDFHDFRKLPVAEQKAKIDEYIAAADAIARAADDEEQLFDARTTRSLLLEIVDGMRSYKRYQLDTEKTA